MAQISSSDQELLKQRFEAELIDKIRLIHFTRPQPLLMITGQGQFSLKEATDLLELVASFSDKVDLEIHNFDTEDKLASKYGVDKIPATVIVGEQDYGLKHFGLPGGRQFAAFIQAIIDASRRNSGVSQTTKDALQVVNAPLHIEVFVSPG